MIRHQSASEQMKEDGGEESRETVFIYYIRKEKERKKIVLFLGHMYHNIPTTSFGVIFII